ncbi:response regulator receiver domain [uncultured Aquimarina sp.]|uniref:response regulator receiver domain n=1 Tax=uncultured Aquimarina sp. TaxID=575652 RepID=UPI002608F0CD|nr:response regulator receiver domain [uncultured Aquimarina sp.]
MSNTFFEKSKEIANDFLQSIVFIDDKAYLYEERNDHELNAQQITQVFARSEKICAVYKPEKLKDIDELSILSKKSDIVVIDWQINLEENEEEIVNNDDDDDVEDHRGQHTRKIIREIVADPISGKGSLKLILIYTGEIILPTITDIIYRDISDLQIGSVNKENCSIATGNVKILVIAKPSAIEEGKEDAKFKHNPDLKEKIISYNNLPDFILTEFTKMTNGLLTNFALISLSEIRKNSGKLLTLFSKELDPAYLSHQSFIPNKEDANELLVELIKDALGNLLSYNEINKKIDEQLVNEWLNAVITEEDKSILSSKGKELNPQIAYNRDIEFLKELLHSDETRVDKRYETSFKKKITDKTIRNDYLKFLSKNNTSLFLNNSQKGLEEEINLKFAKLTHHKSLYISNEIEPKLTLGTVLRSTKNKDNFYLCIQQKCDSVRLYGQERKFLFIPLNISNNGKFQLVTSEGLKLSIDKKSFSIRTIKFNGHENDGVVKAVLQADGSFLFTQKYTEHEDEQFSWELDLKDLHAQRIVDEYASQLSRVGLDESEWLRRWST